MNTPAGLLPSLVGVLVLTAVATVVLAGFRVPRWWTAALAVVRGVVQLALLSLILSGIISDARWIALALAVMFLVAVSVATGRGGWSMRSAVVVLVAMGAGVGVAFAGVFGTGALALTPRYALAVGAIVIGSAMGVAALTGRLFAASRADHWDEVEGWLALGASPRRASLDLARRTARDAMIPGIDQTRTTGLVVLPGAFVGAIFGGLSPFEAAQFQIVVLAAILAASAVASVLVVVGHGSDTRKPVPPA
ncbi:ABC transporter permease [Microbacterium sp. CJ88]|uniref:ABC transporter permease n=1 Tax=Microbacterium sp. CJ88 TaxID=3445672 RepID=UPI003F65A469